MASSPNVVLVHGAWGDGSCWSAVIERLQADGYNVIAPQLPETSPADDVARVRHVLTRQSGPTILAAHSYGGQVPLPTADGATSHGASAWHGAAALRKVARAGASRPQPSLRCLD
jgi:pimeloyl-ACP methyl ester carboxylesterase